MTLRMTFTQHGSDLPHTIPAEVNLANQELNDKGCCHVATALSSKGSAG